MATYTRANAWNQGGTFTNKDLLWYAKGVAAMQARKLDDTASWWFFAAMHGEYIAQDGFPGWGALPAPPQVPVTPLPSKKVSDQYWDQCQHQSWYFLPWHRGYLLALEAHVRAEVVKLGGPATWALPYWDYFGPKTEFTIPPAFNVRHLPDGSPNPLHVTARYGPDSDGKVYVPTPTAIKKHPHDPNFGDGPVTDVCLSNDVFTGDDSKTKPPGFGGPKTAFSHQGGTSGNVEDNPHNHVHVYVGGTAPDGKTYGLMSDPGTAALDPIFYLHHANIDRMWAGWNATSTNTNPTDSKWLNGPAAEGEQQFIMPMPNGRPWVYTPKEVNALSAVDYTYDSLPAPAPAADLLAARLRRLGAEAGPTAAKEETTVTVGRNLELVGASQPNLTIKGPGASTTVALDVRARRKISASLTAASESTPPDRVFLNLENVRGTHDATVLSVYINLPEGRKPGDHPELLAGSVGLFGLRGASIKDGKHGGQGLSFIMEITKIVDALHLAKALDVESLRVTIVPHRPIPDHTEISVGRVSIYRQGR